MTGREEVAQNSGEDGSGEDGAGDRGEPCSELLQELYDELHQRAGALMRKQPNQHTLQPTALVNEAYLRLCSRSWTSRQHFLLAASVIMQRVLIDHARRKLAKKRGEGRAPVGLDGVLLSYEDRAIGLLALQEVLAKLKKFDPKMAQAVELRMFAGATSGETAKILGIPERTLRRRTEVTRAWIYKELV